MHYNCNALVFERLHIKKLIVVLELLGLDFAQVHRTQNNLAQFRIDNYAFRT